MLQPDTKPQGMRAIWPGLKACVTWMVHMGLFAALLWLSAHPPKKPSAAEELKEPAREELPIIPPKKLEELGTVWLPPLPPTDLGTEVPPLDADTIGPCFEPMTPPKLISRETLQYTREALEARVQGLMIVKCTITEQGEVKQCRIIKGLPHMNEAAIAALESRRYHPAQYKGKPFPVVYSFRIKLELP